MGDFELFDVEIFQIKFAMHTKLPFRKGEFDFLPYFYLDNQVNGHNPLCFSLDKNWLTMSNFGYIWSGNVRNSFGMHTEMLESILICMICSSDKYY